MTVIRYEVLYCDLPIDEWEQIERRRSSLELFGGDLWRLGLGSHKSNQFHGITVLMRYSKTLIIIDCPFDQLGKDRQRVIAQ